MAKTLWASPAQSWTIDNPSSTKILSISNSEVKLLLKLNTNFTRDIFIFVICIKINKNSTKQFVS